MKKIVSIALGICLLVFCNPSNSQILKKIKDKTQQRGDQKVDQTIDKGLDKAEDATKKKDKPEEKKEDKKIEDTSPTTEQSKPGPVQFKTYANYDFVPGEKILFEDNFTDDPDGEFPSHWELIKGQAVLNTINGQKSFLLTDGNYATIQPLVKNKTYLGSQFTIEFDTYYKAGAYGIIVFFLGQDGNDIGNVSFQSDAVSCTYVDGKNLTADHSSEKHEAYPDKWHHIAIAYKDKQIKVYLDEQRVLVVPNSNISPASIALGGIGDQEKPIIIKSIRIAEGGGMNMLGKKFTDTKIITHGINFDYNKATIRPESMGTLNMIVKLLNENPELKFEVGGHTDSDGEDAYNLKLSQQRADAVRTQLIAMGIDAGRLTAKGYGESKSIADNNTPEGKANNRRVEFVKQS